MVVSIDTSPGGSSDTSYTVRLAVGSLSLVDAVLTQPHGLAYDAATDALYVANRDDSTIYIATPFSGSPPLPLDIVWNGTDAVFLFVCVCVCVCEIVCWFWLRLGFDSH